MEKLKKYSYWFLCTVIIILTIIILKQKFQNDKNESIFVIPDTNITVRYEKEIKRDTIIKWYEKILYKKAEPEKIFYQKTDTVFVEDSKKLDLMLQVKKENGKLIIKAINQNGITIKEYIYEDVGKNFIAVSQKNNIYVKSKKFNWERINPVLDVQCLLSNGKVNYNLGVETGINYKEKAGINAGIIYSFNNKELFLNTNLKIRF